MTATSGRTPRPGSAARTASVPRLASSSSATRARTTRPGVPAAAQRLGGDDHRRDAGLHVARAATRHPVVGDGGGERLGHALDADGVDVAGEHHRGTGRAEGPDRDEARAVGVGRRRGDDVGLEPAAPQALREVLDDRGLPRRTRRRGPG